MRAPCSYLPSSNLMTPIVFENGVPYSCLVLVKDNDATIYLDGTIENLSVHCIAILTMISENDFPKTFLPKWPSCSYIPSNHVMTPIVLENGVTNSCPLLINGNDAILYLLSETIESLSVQQN